MDLNILKRTNWFGGQLLAYSGIDGKTDFKNALTARTSFDQPGLDIKFPGEGNVSFSISDQGEFLITGDYFSLSSSDKIITGAFIDTYHLLIKGPCEINNKSELISIFSENGFTLIGATNHFDKSKISTNIDEIVLSRNNWLERQEMPNDQNKTTQRTIAKFLSIMKTQIYSPEGKILHQWSTPDRWPHKDMWLWDSVFHAIGWRHIDPKLSQELISAVFDTQQGDGFIAHQMNPIKNSSITQPPVLALGVKLINDILPDTNWLISVYPKLCKYIEWDLKNRDTDGGGLLEWFIEGNENCRSGESGMDNSPRFDTATQVDAVDFNSFLALECEILSELALLLNKKDDADKWHNLFQNTCNLIQQKLWSEEHKFYVDYDVDINSPSPVIASSGFLPLICGAATKEQAEQLAIHLQDPEMFGTSFPVSSIAVKDRDHYSKDMWRGPTWINLNWLIIYGFERYNMNDVAKKLRKQTTNTIEDGCEKFGVSFEYYDDRDEVSPPQLLRKGQCSPDISPYHQVLHDYGWTATLYIDMIYNQPGKNSK